MLDSLQTIKLYFGWWNEGPFHFSSQTIILRPSYCPLFNKNHKNITMSHNNSSMICWILFKLLLSDLVDERRLPYISIPDVLSSNGVTGLYLKKNTNMLWHISGSYFSRPAESSICLRCCCTLSTKIPGEFRLYSHHNRLHWCIILCWKRKIYWNVVMNNRPFYKYGSRFCSKWILILVHASNSILI